MAMDMQPGEKDWPNMKVHDGEETHFFRVIEGPGDVWALFGIGFREVFLHDVYGPLAGQLLALKRV